MTLFIPATLTTRFLSMTTITTTISALLQRDYGPDLERFCRGLAIAIAFSYAAGYALGSWLHHTNDRLAGRLVVRQTRSGDPQPALPLTDAPQPVQRTTRSKLPKPAPKPSRQRRPKGASRTSAPALVA